MLLDYEFWASIVTPFKAMRSTPQQHNLIVDGKTGGASTPVTAARSIKPRVR